MNVLRSCVVPKLPRSTTSLSRSCLTDKVITPLQSSVTRNFSKSSVRNKALQKWKRPSIDEIGVPREPWLRQFERNQKKYNTQLAVGVGLCGFSIFVFQATVNFNTTPSYLYQVDYVTKLPEVDKSETSPSPSAEEDEAIIEEEVEANVVEEVEEPTAAVEEAAAPAVEEPAAVVEEPAPVVEEPAAVVEEPAPVVEEPAAVVEETAEVVEDVGSVVEVKEEAKEAEVVPVVPAKILEPLPESVPYLLVGAGTAAFAACRAIKSRDPTAKILIIGEEDRLPYMRPPLSKELWFVNDEQTKKDLKFRQWNGRERSLYYEPLPFYTPVQELTEAKNGGISVASGRKVVRIDTQNQIAHMEDGATVKYDKCLLATGGKPKAPKFLTSASEEVREKITLFRSVGDFFKLDDIMKTAKSITILGGGFLGSELACAFGQRAKLGELEVNQAYQENGNMAKVLPEYLSEWTTAKVQSEGVKTLPNSVIKSVKKKEDGRIELDLTSSTVETDHVVVAYGIVPDNSLAQSSGLSVDETHGGFVVDEYFEACPNLWIAGDAAAFLDPQLGRRRVEHHDHAIVSGRLAGENMTADLEQGDQVTGPKQAYAHQSMFWSDLGPEVGYEAIGIVDSKLPTVGVFAKATETDTPKAVVTESDESDRSKSEEKATVAVTSSQSPGDDGQDYGKGIIFYLRDNKIVGMVLWNVFNRMNIARRVLKEGKSYDDLTEVAKLFNIHSSE